MNAVSIILLLIIIGGICGIVYVIVYNNLQAYTLKINEAEGLIDELLRKKYDDILMIKDIIIEETDVPEKSFDEVVKLKKQNLSSFDLERKLTEYNNLIIKINDDYDNLLGNIRFNNYFNELNEINQKSQKGNLCRLLNFQLFFRIFLYIYSFPIQICEDQLNNFE